MALPYSRMMMPPQMPGGGQSQSSSPMAIPFGVEQPPDPTGEEGMDAYDVLAQLVKLMVPGASIASEVSQRFNPAETMRGAMSGMRPPPRMGQMGGSMPPPDNGVGVPSIVAELAKQMSQSQMGPQKPMMGPPRPQQRRPMPPAQAQPHFGSQVQPGHFGMMGPQRPQMRTPFDPNKAQQGSTFADSMSEKLPMHESDREREYRMSLNRPRQQRGAGGDDGMSTARFLLGLPPT